MKKFLLVLIVIFLGLNSKAQIGATAPDFTVTDIEGNEINLYEILDAGIIAVVDVSATWCGPCWSLHQSHVLQQLHEAYGPDGSNQIRVLFYEGDESTTLENLEGIGNATLGNWLEGITYPVINEAPLSLDLNVWAPIGFPTVNVVRPSDKQIVADTWNTLTLDGQVSAIESATDIILTPVSVDEVESELEVNVFPNPTSDFLNVELQNGMENSKIEVLNLVGEIVFSTVSSTPVETIDLSNLENGNYLVHVSSSKINMTKKITLLR